MPVLTIAIILEQKLPNGAIAKFRIEIPEQAGAEGFEFLDALEKRTRRIPDPARDRRWLDVMAQRQKDKFG